MSKAKLISHSVTAGVDISCSSTGLMLVLSCGEVIHHSTHGYPLERGVRLQDKTERLINVAAAILRVMRKHMPAGGRVRFEGYAFNKNQKDSNSFLDLAELHGTLRVQLHLAGFVDQGYIPASTARSAVLGKGWGRKSKAEVKTELKRRGYIFDTDDEMDAWVIAMCDLGLLASPKEDLSPAR